MSVSLSTHVLDTERGRPAVGVPVALYHGEQLVSERETDADGRVSPLAEGIDPGAYRLVFHLAFSPYFRRVELEVELDEGHHHVPLLVSSYSCATYRGS